MSESPAPSLLSSVRNSPVPSHRYATPEPSLTELIHAAGRSQAGHAGHLYGTGETLYHSNNTVDLQHPRFQRKIAMAQADNKPVMPPAHIAFRAVFHYNSDRDNFQLDMSPAGLRYLQFDKNLCPFLQKEDKSRSIAFLHKQAGLEFWFRRGTWSIRTGQVSPQDCSKIQHAVRDAHKDRRDLRMTFTVKCELVTRRIGSLFKRQHLIPLHYKVTSAYVEDTSLGTAHVI